jgi:hypothetical protein
MLGELSIWTKNPVCGCGMSSGKMEHYSMTGLVNNGRLTGAFHLTEFPEILLGNQMEHVNFWNDVSLI